MSLFMVDKSFTIGRLCAPWGRRPGGRSYGWRGSGRNRPGGRSGGLQRAGPGRPRRRDVRALQGACRRQAGGGRRVQGPPYEDQGLTLVLADEDRAAFEAMVAAGAAELVQTTPLTPPEARACSQRLV